MAEPTLKQWKRRAIQAEAELESIRKIRTIERQNELPNHRKNIAMKVALDEIKEVLDWAKETMNESN